MSSAGNGQKPVIYQVRMAEETKKLLKLRHQEAAAAGTGPQFLAALRTIGERLRSDPLIFGEPIYRLPVLKLLVRQGIVSPLVVDYAVHEVQPFVFIRGFRVLS